MTKTLTLFIPLKEEKKERLINGVTRIISI